MSHNASTPRFAVCVKNDGCEASLERHKIYRLIPDADIESGGEVKVIDESGEDYVYPSEWFVVIDVPKAVEASLLRAS
jgi:hypothetical protein